MKSGDLGPQYSGDTPFTRKMRLHQSWYRSMILRVACGVGPRSSSKNKYGNMLTGADGERGLNFLTSEIFAVVQERLREGRGAVEPFRLLNNMLSSQPMCFNLFGPLVKNEGLAQMLINAIVPEQVARVLRVQIEWAPEPKSEYLNDRTAFDAFVEYVDEEGKKYGLGIETKLTEPFSQKEYDSEAYRRWMVSEASPWKPEAAKYVVHKKHNQLWRDHLLAVALEQHRSSDYEKCRLMLVRHPEDLECEKITENYQDLLKGERRFIDMPLDKLIERWQSCSLDETSENWLNVFHRRYLNLNQSD